METWLVAGIVECNLWHSRLGCFVQVSLQKILFIVTALMIFAFMGEICFMQICSVCAVWFEPCHTPPLCTPTTLYGCHYQKSVLHEIDKKSSCKCAVPLRQLNMFLKLRKKERFVTDVYFVYVHNLITHMAWRD